jgi:hypothetical protein
MGNKEKEKKKEKQKVIKNKNIAFPSSLLQLQKQLSVAAT